jgi:hypothetical protein
MQKGSLDKYVQLKLQRELFREERVRQYLQDGLDTGDLNITIEKAVRVLDEPKETPQMEIYREEADKLGIETEKLFGVRNVGYSRLDQNLRDRHGLSEILKKAKATRSKNEKQKLMTLAILDSKKKTNYGSLHW